MNVPGLVTRYDKINLSYIKQEEKETPKSALSLGKGHSPVPPTT